MKLLTSEIYKQVLVHELEHEISSLSSHIAVDWIITRAPEVSLQKLIENNLCQKSKMKNNLRNFQGR